MSSAVASRRFVTLDASFIVAYCAKEPKKFAAADAELVRYFAKGWDFFAPAVAAQECLFTFCRQRIEGDLTAEEHTKAIANFVDLLRSVKQPPNGDFHLVSRAEQIRSVYGAGCRRSADSFYLALAEELAANGESEIVTFDDSMERHADAAYLTVHPNKIRVNTLPTLA